jgi:hypothetical protein
METFVIQIGTQPKDSTQASGEELRGLVEHVGSGRRKPFTNARELLAFLRADHRDQGKEADG